MSDGSLSQDEIDALLQGGGGMDLGAPPEEAASAAEPGGGGAGLSPQDLETLTEVLGGLTESQGSSLTGMISKSVTISPPTIEVIANGSFLADLPDQVVQVKIDLAGDVAGEHSYIFSPEIATNIAGLMMGQEDIELNEAALSALEEAGNTIAGTAATGIGERTGANITTTPAQTQSLGKADLAVPSGEFVRAEYSVTIEGEEPASIIEIFDLPAAKGIIGGSGGAADAGDMAGALAGDLGADAMGGFPDAEPAAGLDAAAGLGDLGLGGDQGFGGGQPQADLGGVFGQASPAVQGVQFPSLSGSSGVEDQGNIGLLMDVFMEMTVELGRTKKLIREILGMGEGTIIELDKLAGEPVDILVNHKLIAKGEVVVIDENFGVRVTEIVDPMERVSEM